MKLLDLLQKDARAPNTELAEKLKLSPPTVRKKMQQFEKDGIIMAYRADFDSQKMGYQHFKLFIILRTRQLKRIDAFIAGLKDEANVLSVKRTLERSEVVLNVFAKTNKEFYDIVQKLRFSHPDVIEDYYWNVVYPV
jgi:Lrp/AsnC family leucine-responsive transcriptional regulator